MKGIRKHRKTPAKDNRFESGSTIILGTYLLVFLSFVVGCSTMPPAADRYTNRKMAPQLKIMDLDLERHNLDDQERGRLFETFKVSISGPSGAAKATWMGMNTKGPMLRFLYSHVGAVEAAKIQYEAEAETLKRAQSRRRSFLWGALIAGPLTAGGVFINDARSGQDSFAGTNGQDGYVGSPGVGWLEVFGGTLVGTALAPIIWWLQHPNFNGFISPKEREAAEKYNQFLMLRLNIQPAVVGGQLP
jgi:hypothetical protein